MPAGAGPGAESGSFPQAAAPGEQPEAPGSALREAQLCARAPVQHTAPCCQQGWAGRSPPAAGRGSGPAVPQVPPVPEGGQRHWSCPSDAGGQVASLVSLIPLLARCFSRQHLCSDGVKVML